MRSAIQAVTDSVRACAPGYRQAVIPIQLTIASSGRVTVAVVGGALAGTSQGSCIAQALREARTTAFTGPRLKVTYPIRL